MTEATASTIEGPLTGRTLDAKTGEPVKAKADKAPAKKAATKKVEKATPKGKAITVLVKENPHASGSKRSGWFKKLKAGITEDQASEYGIRATYLKSMARKKVIKIG